jgi:glycosyltransferase involved in cell wall biosynthesis
MKFSVLIANYNNSRFLDAALKSVVEQSFQNWEVILVDDGSTDEFETVILPWLSNKNIKVFCNDHNMGCAFTKSKCAAMASGDVLGFLDPDDTLHPEALEIMINAHIQHPEHSIIHSTHYVCNEFLVAERVSHKPRPLPPGVPYLMISDGSIHAFATFKKSCYNRTSGIPEVVGNDKAIDQYLYYILEEEGSVLFINRPLYFYRIHKGGISNAGQEGAAMKNHFSIIEEACLRRIHKLKKSHSHKAAYMMRQYRTRYYKTRIINSFRRRNWFRFVKSAFIYPFAGGMSDIVNYTTKLIKQGPVIFRKSFVETYKH